MARPVVKSAALGGAPVSDPAVSKKTAPPPKNPVAVSRAEAKPIASVAATPPPAGLEASPASKPTPEKTYSDEEILASVKTPDTTERRPVAGKNAPPWANKKGDEKKSFAKGKPSRATPMNQTRLWMNLGEEHEVKPIDIVNAVAGETGLPGKVVGTVDVRERHLFVDVDADQANGIIAKLNRAQIKGHKVKVKVA